jgi:hypothetical protein
MPTETTLDRVEKTLLATARAAAKQLLDVVRAEAREEMIAELRAGAPTNGHAKSTKPASPVVKPRKKGPIQLCPVPKCINRAAPSLGMVCAKHKGLPKAQIKKYREARRAAKN